jgi:hypothetical protein
MLFCESSLTTLWMVACLRWGRSSTLSEHCWLQYESWESWWGFLQTNMGRYIGTLLSQLVLLESWFNWASRARWKGSGSDPDWHPSWFSWILVFTLRELSPF